MHAFLCAPGFEAALISELRPRGGVARVLTAGVVVAEQLRLPLPATDFAFARQVLPDAVGVRGESIAKLSDAVLAVILPALDDVVEPWRLDVMVPDDPTERRAVSGDAKRAELLEERVLADVKARLRRVSKRRVADDPAARRVQLLLTQRDQVLVSLCHPLPLPSGALWPSPFVAGRAAIEDDWDAPSSAYRKLREALLWLERPIQRWERVVDLGAAPGGWTHVGLAAGAQVVAVDKADMDPRFAKLPGFVHARTDAFKYTPDNPPVDWLVCDVIAAPEKSLELLERWVRGGWMRALVFHLKFKGKDQYALVQAALQMLRAGEFPSARAKQLVHDKNEVTLFGRR